MADVQHSNMAGRDLHQDLRVKQPVRAASTANVTITAPGATLDGVTLANGDRILLKDQTLPAANGIYVFNGAAVAATRSTDATTAADFGYGFLVFVREGTANAATLWQFTQSAALTIGTTALTFQKAGGAGTVTSVAMTVPGDMAVAGSPVTGAGTLAVTRTNQSANQIMAGPASGGAAAPGYRAAVPADLPVFVASGGSHAAGAVPDPGSSSGTTKFLREDATFAVPPGSGGGAGGSGVPVTSYLGSDVNISAVNTYQDILTVSLGPGTWLITALLTVLHSAGSGQWTARIWDGTTNISSGETINNSAGNPGDIGVSAVVSPTSTTTYRVAVAVNAISTATVKAAAPNNAVGNTASYMVAIPVFGYSQSATAPAVATSGTITTAAVSTARVSPAGAVTGVILQAGTYGGQQITVINEAVAANTITFAASGTSNVADGVSSVIPGLRASTFTWDSSVSLWFRSA